MHDANEKLFSPMCPGNLAQESARAPPVRTSELKDHINTCTRIHHQYINEAEPPVCLQAWASVSFSYSITAALLPGQLTIMEGAIPRSSGKRVALVTGGNRGMGFEICRQLASSGLTVVLTARNETRGAEAVDKLRGLGLPDVVFHQLDITEPASAARLADFVRSKFGNLDVLINNAGAFGVTMDVGDEAAVKEMMVGKDQNEIAEWLKQRTTQNTEQAEECVRINYDGTKTVTEALLPLVQSSSDGRIVNVTSAFGRLRFFSGEELRQELSSIETLTKQRLDELSALFLEDYKSGKLEPRGWPTDHVYAAYQASKALVSAYTRILAKENPALRVNCVHPGYVETEMNCNTGDLTAAEGARVSVAIALADQGGVTGVYFDRTEIASFV